MAETAAGGTALRYSAVERHDTARGRATTRRTKLRYARHRARRGAHGTEAIRPRGGGGGGGLRHGREGACYTIEKGPVTRPSQACDTSGPGLQHGQARPATRRRVRVG